MNISCVPFGSVLVPVYRRAFSMFDYQKCGEIETDKIRTILNTLGNPYDEAELERLIRQEDSEGKSLVFSVFPGQRIISSGREVETEIGTATVT